jgi:chromosome segregation and condensation protein ScpB
MMLPLSSPRVDLSQAMIAVLQVLKDAPAMSIAGISQATGIDRRTVGKAIDLIMKVQKSLATQKIEKEKVGKTWVITLRKKTSDFIGSAKSKMKR